MDIGNIAELNTFLVLDAIRSREHVTRRQLVADLGLSNASVSRIVKRLLSAGLIAEEPGRALGQAWRGAGRGAHSFVLISVGTGIGGAVVIDGHLVHGRHNAAGEVGYFPVGRAGLGRAGIERATALVYPERIILDGSIGRALEAWLEDVRTAVGTSVFRAPDIVISKLGPNATVLGAIARALATIAELDGPSVTTSRTGGTGGTGA